MEHIDVARMLPTIVVSMNNTVDVLGRRTENLDSATSACIRPLPSATPMIGRIGSVATTLADMV
jgi:hypothetical protein